uniref:Uncharacterized protein n=1 Tax=Panagrolaimus sp. ES5 TaxID=591445 RepID=A0AC34GU54_9BILA
MIPENNLSNRDIFDKNKFKSAKRDSDVNSSTLSLHIAAYENSAEFLIEFKEKEEEEEGLKSKKFKKEMSEKHFFYVSPAAAIRNPFEFPRQQNYENITPEVMQYTASQSLVYPNLTEKSRMRVILDMIECINNGREYRLAALPFSQNMILVSLYAGIVAIAFLIAAYSYQLYSMIQLQHFVIQEKVPLAVGDDDLVGKETAYRNTKLTGMTQAQDIPAAAAGGGADGGGGGGGQSKIQLVDGTFGNITFENDSTKEQITKMEEKMTGPEVRRVHEKPKSVGLKKEVSGPRSVCLA